MIVGAEVSKRVSERTNVLLSHLVRHDCGAEEQRKQKVCSIKMVCVKFFSPPRSCKTMKMVKCPHWMIQMYPRKLCSDGGKT